VTAGTDNTSAATKAVGTLLNFIACLLYVFSCFRGRPD